MTNKNITKLLNDYGSEYISDLVAVMTKYGSQHLVNQVKMSVEERETLTSLTMLIPQSVFHFSEGRGPGKTPPYNPIYDWVKSHKIQFRDSKGRYITYDLTTKLVKSKIAKYGTYNTLTPNTSKAGSPPKFLHQFLPFKITDKLKNSIASVYRDEVHDTLVAHFRELNVEVS